MRTGAISVRCGGTMAGLQTFYTLMCGAVIIRRCGILRGTFGVGIRRATGVICMTHGLGAVGTLTGLQAFYALPRCRLIPRGCGCFIGAFGVIGRRPTVVIRAVAHRRGAGTMCIA